jgi:deferrochelatase/peroxidase EfeB
VSAAETSTGTSDPNQERGLAFVSYQSQINQGFRFMQQSWANAPSFAPGKSPQPGFDPIIGQNNGGSTFANGLFVNSPSTSVTLPDFVVSRGGEYFFSPSISAILNTLSV